jgi:hypothetical protein
MRRPLAIAGALIAAALILGVLGLVLRALRWLLVIAAVVLLIGAVTGFLGRRATED